MVRSNNESSRDWESGMKMYLQGFKERIWNRETDINEIKPDWFSCGRKSAHFLLVPLIKEDPDKEVQDSLSRGSWGQCPEAAAGVSQTSGQGEEQEASSHCPLARFMNAQPSSPLPSALLGSFTCQLVKGRGFLEVASSQCPSTKRSVAPIHVYCAREPECTCWWQCSRRIFCAYLPLYIYIFI